MGDHQVLRVPTPLQENPGGLHFNLISSSTIYEYFHYETVVWHLLFIHCLSYWLWEVNTNREKILILQMRSMKQNYLTITWQTIIDLSCSVG